MITPKNHAINRFTYSKSLQNPYPTYFSRFKEVLALSLIANSKSLPLSPIYYHQIAVRTAQKKQQFKTADTKFVVDGLAAMKPLKHRKKDKNLTSHNSIIIQSELAKLTDDQLTTLVESGQLNFVIQNGRKIYLNSFD